MKIQNTHKDDEQSQQGGTRIFFFDTIKGWVSEYVLDYTGLGRLCWVNLKGKNGHTERIMCDYKPGRNTYE